MSYCAQDVSATHEVFCVLLEKYFNRLVVFKFIFVIISGWFSLSPHKSLSVINQINDIARW